MLELLSAAAGVMVGMMIARRRAAAPQADLARLRDDASRLRHDLRGILSPALLVADGLIAHEDPRIRRAGEVIVRMVERATSRLAP